MKNFVDKSVYYLVRDAGLADSQYQFSRLCGRNPTWFASIAVRGLPMSIAALGTLAANVALKAEGEQDAAQRRRLAALHELLLGEIGMRCRARAVAATATLRSSPQ